MKKVFVLLVILLLSGLFVPEAVALNVVTTMPNIQNVADEIGGNAVTSIYVAPSTAVHISSDTIDALLQRNSEFIKTADLFLGQGGIMDDAIIAKVTEFCKKNFDKDINWMLLNTVPKDIIPNATVIYDNPTTFRGYSEAVAYLLGIADPVNTSIYQMNLDNYLEKIASATELTVTEKEILADIPIICHFRIKNQAVNWLGMNCINSYPLPTTVKDLIDDIHADFSKYKAIANNSSFGKIIVIENVVAGYDIGVGVHEALKDADIPCECVIFLNLPKSAENVDTILDYYAYNKNLILSLSPADATPTSTEAPLGTLAIITGVFGAIFLCRRI
jgi:ABC-type Zn uptake system ZnuABC Zn-binding protein ZnuA